MNGRSPPFSGTRGLFAGRRASGAGLGAAVSCGRKGHGYAGEDETMPPECGGSSGEGEGVLAGEEVTLIASLCPSKHALFGKKGSLSEVAGTESILVLENEETVLIFVLENFGFFHSETPSTTTVAASES
nr:hypothetical protein TEA_027818 [Ipomoea batatas]